MNIGLCCIASALALSRYLGPHTDFDDLALDYLTDEYLLAKQSLL